MVISLIHRLSHSLMALCAYLVAQRKGKIPLDRAVGSMISSKDSHPLCIVGLGVRHAQAALANPECCTHCFLFPLRVLEHRVRVAAATKRDLSFSAPPVEMLEVAPQTWSWGVNK